MLVEGKIYLKQNKIRGPKNSFAEGFVIKQTTSIAAAFSDGISPGLANNVFNQPFRDRVNLSLLMKRI
jgi:hypothetical protein